MQRAAASLTALLLCLVLAVLGGACDSTNALSGSARVDIGFTAAPLSRPVSDAASAKSSHAPLQMEGPNGTLTISKIRLIVDGVQLKGSGNATDIDVDSAFVSLPLDSTTIEPVASGTVPVGTYETLTLTIENADLEDETREEELRTAIDESFPNWPDEASMVVTGTFSHTGEDTTQEFATYFTAETKVTKETRTALDVSGADVIRGLNVRVDPSRWFAKPDGSLWNLSEYDYARTGAVIDFEDEIEDGVASIEIDDRTLGGGS